MTGSARSVTRVTRTLLDAVPRTECLADVVVRMLPYWYDVIVPDLRHGLVLIAAHGNSLRALIKHLDGLSDEAVVSSTCRPAFRCDTSSTNGR